MIGSYATSSFAIYPNLQEMVGHAYRKNRPLRFLHGVVQLSREIWFTSCLLLLFPKVSFVNNRLESYLHFSFVFCSWEKTSLNSAVRLIACSETRQYNTIVKNRQLPILFTFVHIGCFLVSSLVDKYHNTLTKIYQIWLENFDPKYSNAFVRVLEKKNIDLTS